VKLPELTRKLLPDVRLVSLGGATEASIWSIFYPIDQVDPSWTSIPYGRPLRNQRIYVLDQKGDPCPRGVAGEIYIGGRGVARGYLGAPEQTAGAFVHYPIPIGRVYRTGDLGRYGPDGTIEFLGRLDRQVKIRGHRIELDEIEAVLLRQPGVREATAVPFDRGAGQHALAAYVIPGSDPPQQERLRAALAAALPDYMVPAAIVFLPGLPLTSNGKIDRSALPAPTPFVEDAASEEISDPAAAAMARVWARHLQIDRVGVADDFYALGGDSIIAIHIAVDARRDGFRISPGDILRAKNINALMAVLRSASSSSDRIGDEYPNPPTPMTCNRTRSGEARFGADASLAEFPLSGLSPQELQRVIAKFQRE
jgi:hypothetical protein